MFFPVCNLAFNFDGVSDYTGEISLIKSFIIILHLLPFHAPYSPALTIFLKYRKSIRYIHQLKSETPLNRN